MLRCFFFKQKTAYEVRISDWSSDVCSSDLRCTRALVSVDTTCCAAASAAICSAELRSIFCGDLIAVMYQRVRPDEGVPSSQDWRPVRPPFLNRRQDRKSTRLNSSH